MKILKSILIGLGLFCASGVTPSYAYVECTTKVSRVWNDATLVGIWVIFENGNAGVSSNQATIPGTLSIAMTALTTNLNVTTRYADGFACSSTTPTQLLGSWLVK
jgi:hypothetical protein